MLTRMGFLWIIVLWTAGIAEGNTSNDTNFTNETEVGCLESPKVQGFVLFHHVDFPRLSSRRCLLWPRRCMFPPWMIFPASETQLVTENWATSGLTYGFHLANYRDAISEATYKIYVCFCWENILPWTVRMCQVSNVAFVDNDLDALQIAGATPKDLVSGAVISSTQLKTKMTGWKIHHEWRWISYLTWGFSNVTLVFRGVCFGQSNLLDKSWSVFWRTNDSRCKKRMKIVEAQVMHSCTL